MEMCAVKGRSQELGNFSYLPGIARFSQVEEPLIGMGRLALCCSTSLLIIAQKGAKCADVKIGLGSVFVHAGHFA